MSCLDPTLDVVFKLLLVREPALLRDMLQGILGRPIRHLTILDPEIPGELPRGRRVRFDVRAVLDDGSRVDLEMQRRAHRALTSRLVYYAARDYADQLRQGDEYGLLTPTTGIAWLVEPLFPDLQRLHSIFELRERDTNERLGDQLALHILQPSFLPASDSPGYTSSVGRWARFLVPPDDDDRHRLSFLDPIMATALHTLEQLSQDPRARRLAREREDELKLHRIERAMDLAASRAEGRAEGEASLFLKLIGLRFGSPSEAIRRRVRAAEPSQLEVWAERVLTAQTLAEVFDA